MRHPQGDTGQIAAVMSHHNWLRLRPVVAGKGDACARNPFEQIPRAPEIDVPGGPLHKHSSPGIIVFFPLTKQTRAHLRGRRGRHAGLGLRLLLPYVLVNRMEHIV